MFVYCLLYQYHTVKKYKLKILLGYVCIGGVKCHWPLSLNMNLYLPRCGICLRSHFCSLFLSMCFSRSATDNRLFAQVLFSPACLKRCDSWNLAWPKEQLWSMLWKICWNYPIEMHQNHTLKLHNIWDQTRMWDKRYLSQRQLTVRLQQH